MEKLYKKTINAMHRAIKEYKMIEDGDKIAVGISGGKDSLTLLCCLAYYKKHQKTNFDLVAIAVDVFGNTNFEKIDEFCKKLGVEFVVEKTDISKIVFDIRQEKNPCSLCANLRRGVLNSKAKKLGCNKVALGHHADDFIDTFFMSLINENRLSSFFPKTYLSKQELTVIRPLLYVWENEILSKSENLPVLQNCCPNNKKSEREKVKNFVNELDKKIPNFKKNTLSALTKTERYNLFDKCKKLFNL